MRNKEALFIPGEDTRASKDYPLTLKALENAGFSVQEITPLWEKRNFAEAVQYVSRELRQKIGEKTVVVAHSYGVNLSLPGLGEHKGVGAVLASPSLLCAEAVSSDDSIGRRLAEKSFPGQINTIESYSLAALAKRVRIKPTHAAVLLGEAEAEKWPIMKEMAHLTAHNLGVGVTYASSASHFIDYYESYIEATVEAAERIHHNLNT